MQISSETLGVEFAGWQFSDPIAAGLLPQEAGFLLADVEFEPVQPIPVPPALLLMTSALVSLAWRARIQARSPVIRRATKSRRPAPTCRRWRLSLPGPFVK